MNLRPISIHSAFDLRAAAIIGGHCPICFSRDVLFRAYGVNPSFFLYSQREDGKGAVGVDTMKLRGILANRCCDCVDVFDFNAMILDIQSGIIEVDAIHWQHVPRDHWGIVANIDGKRMLIDGVHAAYAANLTKTNFYHIIATDSELELCVFRGDVEEVLANAGIGDPADDATVESIFAEYGFVIQG